MADTFVNNPAPSNEAGSFGKAVGEGWMQGLIPQAVMAIQDSLPLVEPGYHAKPEDLKGFEPYADRFMDSQSPQQTELIKQHIRENEERERYIGSHGGFWSNMAATALDPTNYIAPMVGEGQGLLKGALMSSITQAGATGVQTWATSKVSPTASVSDAWANMLYAGLFAGVLGGYLGRKGQAVAHEYAGLVQREFQAQDARLGGVSLEHGAPEAMVAHGPENPGARPIMDGSPLGAVSHESLGSGDMLQDHAGTSNVIQFPGSHADVNAPVASAGHSPGQGGAIMGNLALKLEEELPVAKLAEGADGVRPGEGAAGAAAKEAGGEGKGGKGKGGGGKGGGGGEEPPEGGVGGPIPNNGGAFRVVATGPDKYGLAPAYGIEKLFAKLTLGTNIISRGVKSAGDLVQRMVGEGSVLTTDNLKGIASPNSVALASKQWVAFAQDAETQVKNIWGQMRGQATPGATSVGMTQAADAIRSVTRGTNPGGLPRLGEFKEMLFRARVATDQAAYLASLDPAVRPYVQQALIPMHQFYERMGREAVDAGVLSSPEHLRRQAQTDRDLYSQRKARVDELMDKPEALSPNEEAELHFIMAAQSDLMDRLSRNEFRSMATDKELADKIDEIQWKGEARQQSARDFRDKLQAQLVTVYETQQKIMEVLQGREDAGQPLSPAQKSYLEDLKKKHGPDSAPADAVSAYKLNNPLEPFDVKDPKFNPPANDPNTVVDKWEDRRDTLNDTVKEKFEPGPLEGPPSHFRAALVHKLKGWDAELGAKIEALGKYSDSDLLDHARDHLRSDVEGHVKKVLDKYGADLSEHERQNLEVHATSVIPEEGDMLGFEDMLDDEAHLDPRARQMLEDIRHGHDAAYHELEGLFNDLGEYAPDKARLDVERLKHLPKYETGKPTVFDAFHGTNASWIWDDESKSFRHFDNSKLGGTTNAGSAKLGHFSARNPETSQASSYTASKRSVEGWNPGEEAPPSNPHEPDPNDPTHNPNVLMVRGRMENPFVVDMAGLGYNERKFTKNMQEAKAAGHDGVIFMNTTDGAGLDVIYAVFDADSYRYRFDPGAKKASAETPKVGVITGKRDLPKAANDVMSDAQKAEMVATQKQRELIRNAQDKANLSGLTAAQEAYVHDMLNQIEGGKITMPVAKKGENYVNIVWNHDAVNRDPDKLRAIFEQHYREQGGVDPKIQADRSVAAILSHDPTTQIFDPAEKAKQPTMRPSPSQQRMFDIPTERVVDFLQTDTGHLMHDYARAFGAGIEASKAFGGDPFARNALHDVRIQAARELQGANAQSIISQVDDMGHQLDFARDAMLGRQRTGSPLTMDGVVARFLKNFASTTSLGGVGLSAIAEAARPLMTRGISDTIGATFDIFSNRSLPELQKMSAQFRMLMGEFGEVAHGMSGSRVMEMGGVPSRLGSPTAMALDRKLAPFNELAEKHFYVANGLAHVTDFLKNWTSLLSAHFMIDDIRAVADGTASAQTITNLAGYGIEKQHAERMMATDAFSKYGSGGNLVDMAKFNDPELVSKFSQAVQMEVRRTVNTPGTFDKSMIQQGFYVGADGKRREMAMMTLPFQFMSWGIAANNKLMMSALQGRDASAFAGAAALVGMGYFVSWIKSGGTGAWQNMSAFDKIAISVEQSGLIGSFDNLNNMIETASQNTLGVRPMLGMGPKWGVEQDGADAIGVPFGPVGAKAMDIYKAFDPSATQDERASTIRRSIPFTQLPYFKGIFKGVQDGAMSMLQ